jgi:pyruvate/2-oxoglutarate dehydrogenase complex dihydrolipoamide dehydrogenase (E3) component/uncharacterized membrane protein YdjX (TVP38/TMEM64 family)
MTKIRMLVIAVIVAALIAYVYFDLSQFFTLAYAQQQLGELRQLTEENFLLAATGYFLIYVLVTALSVPGAAVMTLLGGAVFGLFWGLLLVSFASSIGATLAFLVARLLLRDWVQQKFGRYLKTVNEGIKRDGSFYLFTLRMVPLFPFFLINLVMGLTPMKVVTFYLVSQIGMLLGTAVYVNAGAELGQLDSLGGLLSPTLILSFTLVALMPWLARGIVGLIQRRKVYKGFTRPRRFDTNVVVVGAGSAGLVASLIVAGAKARVTLIEKNNMGGDCLNTGCVPSKTLIRSARMAHYMSRSEEYGLKKVHAEVDFPAVMSRVQSVIKTIEPHDSVERFTSLGVDCIMGEARITSPWTVEVNDKVINTRAIIVATGARPLIPEIAGLAKVDYLHSDNVWSLTELPRRLLVLGGGPIGCELAQSFARLGAEVTLVDQGEQLLPREDADAATQVHQQLQRDGIRILLGHKAERFEVDGGSNKQGTGGTLHVSDKSGAESALAFDRVLLAVGRRPNVEGFGLNELSVPLNDNGTVSVNEFLQTRFPNIYACGDVAGPYQFTHMASYQAWYAALNALAGGVKKFRVRYPVVPWCTFTDPEVARVGISEAEAERDDIEYEVTRYEMTGHDRALADGEAHGFVKVLTAAGSDRILGATIVGYHAGELIGEFVTAMTHGMGLKKVAATNHIYPTMLEANRFAANAWRSKRLSVKLLGWSERWFRFMRG